jgi:hypothetical protein
MDLGTYADYWLSSFLTAPPERAEQPRWCNNLHLPVEANLTRRAVRLKLVGMHGDPGWPVAYPWFGAAPQLA